MSRFSPRQPLYLGSDADDTDFGGKAGTIAAWVVTLVAIGAVVVRIAVSLVAGR